jgi:hypothetical protein
MKLVTHMRQLMMVKMSEANRLLFHVPSWFVEAQIIVAWLPSTFLLR